jgi:hypothetical protein
MTTVSRRNILIVAGLTPAAAAMPASAQRTAPFPASLPDKTNFNQDGVIYLDSGSQHPIGLGSRMAGDDYFDKRMQPGKPHKSLEDSDISAKFTKLINAGVTANKT